MKPNAIHCRNLHGSTYNVSHFLNFATQPFIEFQNLLESGITLHTKAGNEPVVLNVSSDQISNSKLIKISNTFFEK